MSVQVKGSGTIGGLDEGLVVSGIITSSTQLNVGSNIKLGSAGIVTASNFKTGVSNLHDVGLTLSGGQLDVGSNIKLGTAGVVTATSFVGSGANLTGITQTTINSNADNRIITGSGTANTLNGESTLTYSGDTLLSTNSNFVIKSIDTNASNAENRIQFNAGKMFYETDMNGVVGSSSQIFNVDGSERFRVKTDGIKVTSANAHGSAIQMYNTDSSSNVWYVNGEGNSFIGHTYPRSDANMDLGFHTGYRWRDLIVSGGIRFGASGDAHYLNDYEEGEYTANLRVTSGSATFDSGSGNKLYYTKIGDIVYINGGFSASSVSGAGGNLQVSLPFATKNSSAGVAKGAIGSIWNYYGSNNPYGNYGWYTLHGEGLNANVSNNITLAILGYNSQNSNWGPIGGLIGNNSQVHFSFTYRTN